jgi:L-rhamnose mutarotase
MTVFTINLKDDPKVVEAYQAYHREVWPEVQQSLRRFGVERMDIYLLGRRLVMVVDMREGVDYRDAFRLHSASSPRVAQWEQLMTSFQEPVPEAAPGEWWAAMEPVFQLEQEIDAPGLKSQQPAIDHLANGARTS